MPADEGSGHVGHLTEEEERKLKEFWVAMFNIFGVKSLPDTDSNTTALVNGEKIDSAEPAEKGKDAQSTDTKGKDKEKVKSRLGSLLSRKRDAENATDTQAVQYAEDDKYGQTKEFQKTMAEFSPEELRSAVWGMVKADDPDALLLRYLRARNWKVDRALIMLISTARWRLKVMHVDDHIMLEGDGGALEMEKSSDKAVAKEAEDFLNQLRMGKCFLHGVDKKGRPICHIRVRLHRASEQSASSLERLTVYTIETGRLMLIPPVETATLIFDLTDFVLANLDLTLVKFIIKCFEANYPESLGVVLIHKAPWVFQAFWNLIKSWLDPVVAAKVHFTRSADDLEEFIDRKNMTKELEGEEEWEYKYADPKRPEDRPVTQLTEEEKSQRDKLLSERNQTVLEYEEITQKWIKSNASSKSAPEQIAKLKEERSALASKLRHGYWELDPYLRTKSMYDRLGIINEQGKIDFYPARKGTENGHGQEANGEQVRTGGGSSSSNAESEEFVNANEATPTAKSGQAAPAPAPATTNAVAGSQEGKVDATDRDNVN